MRSFKFIIKSVIVLMLFVVIFSARNIGVEAKKVEEQDLRPLFEETITLEDEHSVLEIGFAKVTFKKGILEEDQYPITFTAKLYAENGKIYIEFDPDVEEFFKDVTIKVSAYEGYIYDVAIEDYIYVEIPKLKIKVPHFSRWCFVW